MKPSVGSSARRARRVPARGVSYQEVGGPGGHVVRQVVITLDTTMNTATVLTRSEAVEVANALR